MNQMSDLICPPDYYNYVGQLLHQVTFKQTAEFWKKKWNAFNRFSMLTQIYYVRKWRLAFIRYPSFHL